MKYMATYLEDGGWVTKLFRLDNFVDVLTAIREEAETIGVPTAILYIDPLTEEAFIALENVGWKVQGES